MTSKINMLEHDNNVLAHQNFSQQIKITRLEGELEKVKAERDDEIARVKVLRKVWDQTTRDLVKAEGQVEYGRRLFKLQAQKTAELREQLATEIKIRDSILDDLKAEAVRADKLDHALNLANQALYVIDRG